MKKILLVDYFQVDVLLIRIAIESHFAEYQVTVAVDDVQVYRLLRELEFNLVVVDFHMPLLDRFELLERMHADDLRLPPTIIVSGFGAVINRARALALGAFDFIHKAIDFEVFKRELGCAIGQLNLIKTPSQLVDERRVTDRRARNYDRFRTRPLNQFF